MNTTREERPAAEGVGTSGAARARLPRHRALALAALAALPGLALAVASLGGAAPTLRDLPSYFVPLRQHTAAALAGRVSPLWTDAVGCGEPFFANPQSGLLYPPAWLAAVLPAPGAVGVEAGLHLALLGVGCLLLARRLGAAPLLALAAAWGAVLAGPTCDAVGVLNNLDALAWAPWVWWGALAASLPVTAGALALTYLAAEPQLAVIIGAVALALAPRRRTVAALLLAMGLVAVQAVPFLTWVRGGNRGPGREIEAVCAGALLGEEAAAMLAPGAELPERGDRYIANLAVPLWLLVLGAAALGARDRRVRTLAAAGWILLALAALPGAPWGRPVWAFATLGLVRYPARLVLPALLALAPAAAAAWRPGRRLAAGAAAAAGLAVVAALATGGSLPETAAQGVAAVACAVPPLAPWSALAGAAVLAPRDAAHLSLAGSVEAPPPPCLTAQRARGARVYVVEPSRDQVAWVNRDPEPRRIALGWGYVPLVDGRRTVRTFGPLQSRRLLTHLEQADRGPDGRWWLDALAARAMVAQHAIAGLAVLCREGGVTVHDNPGAWPEAQVLRAIPQPGEVPRPAGTVLAAGGTADRRSWRVRLDAPGVLLWSATPDPGWRFAVDGAAVSAEAGPGILQGVPVGAGDHLVEARYLPSGIALGAVVSLLSLAVLVGVATRRPVSPRAARRPPPS